MSTLENKRIIELPFEIMIPEYIPAPEEIQLLDDRILPKRIALKEGFVLPDVEFDEQEVPTRSLRWIGHPNTTDAIFVKIFPQFLERDEQYVEFKLSPDIDTPRLIGHCLLPTNTLPHGPVEDWEFQTSGSDRVRLRVPVALYWEFILPYYFQNFWLGLSTHLEYLDPESWWTTY